MNERMVKAIAEIEEKADEAPEGAKRLGVVCLTLAMAFAEAIANGEMDVANEYAEALARIGNGVIEAAKDVPELTLRFAPADLPYSA